MENNPPSFLVGVAMGSDFLGVLVGEVVGEGSFLVLEGMDERTPGLNCIETGRPTGLVGGGS